MLLSPPESVVTCVQQGGRCGQDYGHFDVHVVVPENVHDDHEEKLSSLQVPNSCHTKILRIQGEIVLHL